MKILKPTKITFKQWFLFIVSLDVTYNSYWCSGSVLWAPFQLACNPWSSSGSPSLYRLWNHPCLYQTLQKLLAALENIQTQNWEQHVTKKKSSIMEHFNRLSECIKEAVTFNFIVCKISCLQNINVMDTKVSFFYIRSILSQNAQLLLYPQISTLCPSARQWPPINSISSIRKYIKKCGRWKKISVEYRKYTHKHTYWNGYIIEVSTYVSAHKSELSI